MAFDRPGNRMGRSVSEDWAFFFTRNVPFALLFFKISIFLIAIEFRLVLEVGLHLFFTKKCQKIAIYFVFVCLTATISSDKSSIIEAAQQL